MRTSASILSVALAVTTAFASAAERFEGRFFRGQGDREYLELLDIARRMLDPDPEFQNLPMLYTPAWNGFVEGPTWDAWWIQNSYGTTYCVLPLLDQPYQTFLANSHDLWFDQMGDGKTVRPFRHGNTQYDWVPPDGCLCDAARPGWFVAKQGDGRVDIHDWGMEFTAAGLLMQCELLLVRRDRAMIERYLSRLERCAAFIETRRDPANDLFLAGPAANLLAPSYAGWKKPDGTYGQAYLTGLSVTYVAALDRLIEVERLAGRASKADEYAARRHSARRALARLTTEEGYLIRSLDPDGTRHGVYGAPKHGYFEASPNHDAIALRVVDDGQARRIFEKIASIPGLRPYGFILPNYPSLDDMYEKPEGLWAFGTWVNGGHWSTCEGRMILAYYRLGQYEDARRSMKHLLDFARRFRMDNPLTKFGSDVYQPHEPINLCYDTFAPAAALVRGLFEYLYRADSLLIIPHIPPGITALEQRFPVFWGAKRLYLSLAGQGPITAVYLDDEPHKVHDGDSVTLRYDDLPPVVCVRIARGGASIPPIVKSAAGRRVPPASAPADLPEPLMHLTRRAARMLAFAEALARMGQGEAYEAAHARLAAECVAVIHERRQLQAAGRIAPLPEVSQIAADRSYVDTAVRLCDGLEAVLAGYEKTGDAVRRRMFELWRDLP